MRPIILCTSSLRPHFAPLLRRKGPKLNTSTWQAVGSTDRLPLKVEGTVRSAPYRKRGSDTVVPKAKTATGQKMESRNKGHGGANDNPKFQFIDATLRGMGQVVFANSPLSGLSIIGGLAIADPLLSSMSLLGCTAATATGKALSPKLGLSDQSVNDGLSGYNGALVGCAFTVFLDLGTPSIALATVLGGAASTVVSAGLGRVITGVPQFTLAFNAVALGTLAFTKPFGGTTKEDGEQNALVVDAAETNATDALSAAAIESSPLALADSALSLAPFTGVSQIFVADSWLCGSAILAALYVQKFDPRGDKKAAAAVAHTVVGSCLGMGTALGLGLPAGDVAAGLSGFNPALTALAVHTFLQPSVASYGIAGGGAIATAILTGAVAPIAAASLQIPVCTVPFCIAASGCLVTADLLGVEKRV